jgi:NADPH2:quinone reductase
VKTLESNIAALCLKKGDHRDVSVQAVPVPPQPEHEEIQVEVMAAGVQFSDLLKFSGSYQTTSVFPFVVGSEAAGIVRAVGSGVNHLKVGDSVLTSVGCIRLANTSARSAIRVPDGIDLQVAASFRNNYQTALDGLTRARLQPGEVLLVHGAAGGVGLAAIDIGLQIGARVIGVVSNDAKKAIVARYGAEVILRDDAGFRSQILDLVEGGADVIFDPVGGDTFDESVRCVAPFGRILVVGFTSGRPGLAKTHHLLVKDVTVIGFTVGGLSKVYPEVANNQLMTLMRWLATGRIKPFISFVLPISDIQEAYQLIVDRQSAGKVVIDFAEA